MSILGEAKNLCICSGNAGILRYATLRSAQNDIAQRPYSDLRKVSKSSFCLGFRRLNLSVISSASPL